jgi:hypothetical protein
VVATTSKQPSVPTAKSRNVFSVTPMVMPAGTEIVQPSFKKCANQSVCNPENSMPFFLSAEPWSWTKTLPSQLTPTLQAPSFLNQALHPQQKQ